MKKIKSAEQQLLDAKVSKNEIKEFKIMQKESG